MLYVEGARDHEILSCWARRVDPGLARCIESSTVILGGRRPARAIADFRKRGGRAAGLAGLIVLDRDHHEEPAGLEPRSAPSERSAGVFDDAIGDGSDGLELFVWSLRHIESYLLVPAAIRRLLRREADDRGVERLIASEIARDAALAAQPLAARGGHGSVHAKRILGPGGSLSEALGAELRAGEIARAMRVDELHADVHALFDRIGGLAGLAGRGPEVVIRGSSLDEPDDGTR